MKDFNPKNIITNDLGQIMFPNEMTVINSRKYSPGTEVTTANMNKDMIGITPYGAYMMQPGMEYSTAGNKTLEIPLAQMGGEDDQQAQLMQIIQIYAQMRQVDPRMIIQELQNMPEDQRNQSLQAIVQEVQSAMQQQQMQEQPDESQGMEMPMAKDGGCMDCQEQFPQAQNLNWFYKAMGGEAFPQANKYPESWAEYSGTQYKGGGEAFPQAQTYLPYDRPGETRPNFMFEYGGQPDLDTIYRKMKDGGLNLNPRKKKGGEMSKDDFLGYLQEGGLKKFQGTDQSQYSMDEYMNTMPRGTQFVKDASGQTVAVSPQKYLSDRGYYTDPIEDQMGYDNNADMAFNVAFNTDPNLSGYVDNYNMIKDALTSRNSSASNTTQSGTTSTGTTPTIRNPFLYDKYKYMDTRNMQTDSKNQQQGYTPSMGTSQISPSQYAQMLLGRREGFIPKALSAVFAAGDIIEGFTGKRPNLRKMAKSAIKPLYGIPDLLRRKSDQQLPTRQAQQSFTSGIGIGDFQKQQRQQQYDKSLAGLKEEIGYDQNQEKQKQSGQRPLTFNTPYASRMVGAANTIGDFFSYMNEQKDLEKLKKMGMNTSAMIQPIQGGDRGDYLTNVTQGTALRPDQMQYAQSPGRSMMEQPAFYDTFNNMKTARKGGSVLDMFEDGGVYDLDEQTIKMIMAAGGKVEYI